MGKKNGYRFQVIKVKRAQIRSDKKYLGAVNITVKAQTPFSPNWSMVIGHKHGILSDEQYTQLYNEILDAAKDSDYRRLFEKAENNTLTLLCYCRDDWFCHTHLLIKRLKEKFPDKII